MERRLKVEPAALVVLVVLVLQFLALAHQGTQQLAATVAPEEQALLARAASAGPVALPVSMEIRAAQLVVQAVSAGPELPAAMVATVAMLSLEAPQLHQAQI